MKELLDNGVLNYNNALQSTLIDLEAIAVIWKSVKYIYDFYLIGTY